MAKKEDTGHSGMPRSQQSAQQQAKDAIASVQAFAPTVGVQPTNMNTGGQIKMGKPKKPKK